MLFGFFYRLHFEVHKLKSDIWNQTREFVCGPKAVSWEKLTLFYFKIETPVNKLARTCRWQHCALGSGEERPPKTWNAILCASEPFTSRWPVHPAPHRGWNQPQPLLPFAVKSTNHTIQHWCSYFDRKHSYFRFFSRPALFNWRAWRRLSPLRGALRANNFLTWQNGEKLTHRNLAKR